MEKFADIPEGAEVTIENMKVTAKGSVGELTRDFEDPRYVGLIKIEKEDSKVKVSTKEGKKMGAVVGTVAAHIRNMLIGVSIGYQYSMKITYTHFPMTVTLSGDKIEVKNFFGEKNIRYAKVVGNVEVKIEKDLVTITGADVEQVGQTAANIERATKLVKRDRRIFQDGIYLTERRLKNGENV